ncbi:MAG: hypothetical protein KIT72_08415 [Polyangiaceae bacterium]|nr:hypothetical protein [Polyangiaceae bacterium]MCW5790430.1 hypothetical protein [Polyangiaceae bacterium]
MTEKRAKGEAAKAGESTSGKQTVMGTDESIKGTSDRSAGDPEGGARKPWALILAAAGAVAALVGISLVTPSERAASAEPEQLTAEAFRERLMHHWYMPEQAGVPLPADAAALIGVKPGDTLAGGWKVRGVRIADQTIRVELGQEHAVYSLVVALAGRTELPPVRTERYQLTEEGRRPAPSAFEGLDLQQPRDDLEKRLREREMSVPVPQGLQPPS